MSGSISLTHTHTHTHTQSQNIGGGNRVKEATSERTSASASFEKLPARKIFTTILTLETLTAVVARCFGSCGVSGNCENEQTVTDIIRVVVFSTGVDELCQHCVAATTALCAHACV